MIRTSKKILLGLFIASLGSVALADDEPSLNAKDRFFLRPCYKAYQTLKRLGLDESESQAVADALISYRDGIEATQEDFRKARLELLKDVIEYDDEIDIDETFENYSLLLKERVILNANLMSEIKSSVDPLEYKKILAARVNLFHCTRSPRRVFTKVFGKWVQENMTTGSDESTTELE
jgi:hypothetical protein